MAIYEIYANNNREQTRFVRDKGAFLALVFPVIWLAWNRLWFALVVYLCFAGFFLAIGNTSWAVIAGIFSFLPGLYLFLEGPVLLAQKHQRDGLQLVDVIDADSFAAAELKWFSKPASQNSPKFVTDPTIGPGVATPLISKSVTDRPEFGLFAEE